MSYPNTEGKFAIVSCRRYAGVTPPGHRTGYQCTNCRAELVVSPPGQRQIHKGGKPFCNPCAERLLVLMGGADKIHFNPAAMSALGLGSAAPKLTDERSLFQSLGFGVETLPSGNWGAYETMGAAGRIPKRPEWLICDCCGEKATRFWLWRHYGFCLGDWRTGRGRREYLAGEWAFCVRCRVLKENLPLLVARCVTLNLDLPVEAVTRLFETMLACLWGDVAEWQSGQPYTQRRGNDDA